MEQDNDLKYFMRVKQVQHLLAVYGIEDCEPSGENPYLLATTEPHTLSKIIHVGLGSVLRTQDLAFSKEVHDEYEELLEVMQLHDFLKSCLGSKITINGTITQQGQSKGFNSEITLRNTLLQNRILSMLDKINSNASEIDKLLAKNINNKEPLRNEKLGFFAWHCINRVFKGFEFEKVTKTKRNALIYDLMFSAGCLNKQKKVITDKGGEHDRDKSQFVINWLTAFEKTLNKPII